MPMPNKMTMMTDSGSSNKSKAKVNTVKTNVTSSSGGGSTAKKSNGSSGSGNSSYNSSPTAYTDSGSNQKIQSVKGNATSNSKKEEVKTNPSSGKINMSKKRVPDYMSAWKNSYTPVRPSSSDKNKNLSIGKINKVPVEVIDVSSMNSNAARLEKLKLKTSDNNKASSDSLNSNGYYISNMVGNNIKNVEYIKNINLNEGYASVGGAKVKLNPKYINNDSMVSGIAIKDSNGKVLDYYVLSNATFDKNKNKYYYSGSHNGVASGVYADDIENWLNKNYYNSDGTVKNGLSLNLLVGNKSNEKSNSYDITPMAWINEDSIELNKETNKNASNSNLSKSEAPKKVALGSAGDFKQNYGGYNIPTKSSVNKAASVNGATATNWDYTKGISSSKQSINTANNRIVGNNNTLRDIWTGNNKADSTSPILNPNITPLMQYSAKQTGLTDKAEGMYKVKEFINNTSTQVSKVTSSFSKENAVERRMKDEQIKYFTNSKLQTVADQLGIAHDLKDTNEANKVKNFVYGTSSQAATVFGNKEKQIANIKAIPDIVSKNPKNTTPGKESIGGITSIVGLGVSNDTSGLDLNREIYIRPDGTKFNIYTQNIGECLQYAKAICASGFNNPQVKEDVSKEEAIEILKNGGSLMVYGNLYRYNESDPNLGNIYLDDEGNGVHAVSVVQLSEDGKSVYVINNNDVTDRFGDKTPKGQWVSWDYLSSRPAGRRGSSSTWFPWSGGRKNCVIYGYSEGK